MKFSSFLTFFVGTPVLLTNAATTTISQRDGQRIEDDINNLRSGKPGNRLHPSSTNSRYVHYNTSVQNMMDSWFNTQLPNPNPSHMTNGDACWGPANMCRTMMEDKKFAPLVNEGWGWYFFDSTKNGATAVSGIIDFRARRQLSCFDYSACDPNEWTWYGTCYNVNVSRSMNCNHFNKYLPPMLDSDLAQISCKLTGKPGPYNVKGQPNSFYCIAQLLDKRGKPNMQTKDYNDQPFTAVDAKHAACSDCPDDAPKCYKNLCIDEIPKSKTPSPMLFSTSSPTTALTTKKPAHRGLRTAPMILR